MTHARVSHGWLLLAALVVLGVAAGALTASRADASGSLRASRASGFLGDRVTFTGSLPPKRSRAVALQRKSGKAWIVVRSGKTAKNGTFSLATTIRSASTTYRVYAKPQTLGAKRYKAVASSSRTIATLSRPDTRPLPSSGPLDQPLPPAPQEPANPSPLPAVDLPGSPDEPPAEADTVAPPIPSGLAAAADDAAVHLSWEAVGSSDLAGYHIYRASSETGPWAKVTAAPITGTSFAVTGLGNGDPYWFAVASADVTGNASELSAVSSATPLAPVSRLQVANEFSTVLQLDWDNPSLAAARRSSSGGQPDQPPRRARTAGPRSCLPTRP